MKEQKKCEACARRTSWVGLTAGILLASFKFSIGLLGRSHALVASGMCNLSDIASASVIILGGRYSQKPPNKRYPYGYGKLEFIVQFGISLFMILGNTILIMSSFIVIAKHKMIVPHVTVFFAAMISAVVNGLIYKFARCGAKELNSPALKSHAEHNKIDVASSLLVAIGILATRAGLHWADPLIAIFECIHIIYGSLIILGDGFKGIMDASVPEEYIHFLNERILQIEDIKKVTKIKARHAGRKIFLDIAMQLDPHLSVLEAKKITQTLRAHLRKENRHLGNIFVQVTPAP
ncbi:MAG: cation transporter [Candidatus Omnitrophota bacterium]|nr:MAG: cation transporter [Candidatus Omnitrophota bacterium]